MYFEFQTDGSPKLNISFRASNGALGRRHVSANKAGRALKMAIPHKRAAKQAKRKAQLSRALRTIGARGVSEIRRAVSDVDDTTSGGGGKHGGGCCCCGCGGGGGGQYSDFLNLWRFY